MCVTKNGNFLNLCQEQTNFHIFAIIFEEHFGKNKVINVRQI